MDNDKPQLDLVVKKTDRNLVIPLNSNALAILPEVVKQKTKIFPTITNQALNLDRTKKSSDAGLDSIYQSELLFV